MITTQGTRQAVTVQSKVRTSTKIQPVLNVGPTRLGSIQRNTVTPNWPQPDTAKQKWLLTRKYRGGLTACPGTGDGQLSRVSVVSNTQPINMCRLVPCPLDLLVTTLSIHRLRISHHSNMAMTRLHVPEECTIYNAAMTKKDATKTLHMQQSLSLNNCSKKKLAIV